MSDESKFELLHDDIKDVQKTQTAMSKTLTENTVILGEHVRRTSMLEDRVEPLYDHVMFMKKLAAGTTWIAGIVSAIAGFIWAVGNLF